MNVVDQKFILPIDGYLNQSERSCPHVYAGLDLLIINYSIIDDED